VSHRYELLLALSAVLFCMGLAGVMIRRNLLVMLMCMELMLNGCSRPGSTGELGGGVDDGVRSSSVIFVVAAAACCQVSNTWESCWIGQRSLDVEGYSRLKG